MSELESLGGDEDLDKHLRRHGIDRLVMLCDGVFAIAATLAAVEIHVPTGATLAEVVGKMDVGLIAYLISFIVIAMFWTNNRDVFARLHKVDRRFTSLVLAMLSCIALIPTSIRIVGPPGGSLGGAFAFYALVMTLSGSLNCAIWAYASFREGLMFDEVPRGYRWRRIIETATMPLMFGVLLAFPTVDTLKWMTLVIVIVIAARRVLIARLLERPTA